jgi:hypothetical protein
MIRITALLWIALLVVAGGTVMNVSYEVRRVQRHLADIAHDAEREQDAIRILQTEWTTLNSPGHIDDLAQRHLSLQSTPIQRFVALEDIPLKPAADQLPKPADASSKIAARTALDHRSAKKPNPVAKPTRSSPTVEAAVAAPQTPATASPGVDGVGLILARIERAQ